VKTQPGLPNGLVWWKTTGEAAGVSYACSGTANTLRACFFTMEALAIIAGIAALVWGSVVLLRGGLLGGCLMVLLAAACFSVPFFKMPLGPVPLTADRVLLVLVVLQYVVWRRCGWVDPKPLGKPEILLLVFLAMLVVSTFSADWTASNDQPLAWLIVYYLTPAVVYWIARQTPLSERAILTLFACFALFGVYLAATSLAEYFEAWWLVFPRYIVTTAMDKSAEFVGRGRGPLLNPIANGVMLTICLSTLLLWWPRLKRPGKLLLAATASLLVMAISLSLTRSVWLGGAFALALLVAAAIPWNWRLPLLGGGLLLAIFAAGSEWETLLAFKRDKNLSAEETASSVQLRPIMAVVAWHMFLDRPLFGCGYSQYKSEHLNYVSDRSTDLPLERARGYIPHNVALSLLTETGLVGFGLFSAILFFWIRDAWRLWRKGDAPLWVRQQGLLFLVAASVYLINGMFHDVSVVPMANLTLFFLAGVTAGLRPSLPRVGCQGPTTLACPRSPLPNGEGARLEDQLSDWHALRSARP
jgi:O-antigen ligase